MFRDRHAGKCYEFQNRGCVTVMENCMRLINKVKRQEFVTSEAPEKNHEKCSEKRRELTKGRSGGTLSQSEERRRNPVGRNSQTACGGRGRHAALCQLHRYAPGDIDRIDHIVPWAVLGLKVVTMKTEGWVFTFRP